MTLTKVSYGQAVFQVGTSHLKGFAKIYSRTQYTVLWWFPETLGDSVGLFHKTGVRQKFIIQEFAQCNSKKQNNADLPVVDLLWSCKKEYWLL